MRMAIWSRLAAPARHHHRLAVLQRPLDAESILQLQPRRVMKTKSRPPESSASTLELRSAPRRVLRSDGQQQVQIRRDVCAVRPPLQPRHHRQQHRGWNSGQRLQLLHRTEGKAKTSPRTQSNNYHFYSASVPTANQFLRPACTRRSAEMTVSGGMVYRRTAGSRRPYGPQVHQLHRRLHQHPERLHEHHAAGRQRRLRRQRALQEQQ